MLTRDQILAAADIEHRDVPVPEWGGAVRVRNMTGADRDAWEQWLIGQRGEDSKVVMENLRARMVAMSVVGEDGGRLFTDDDVAALGGKSAKALDRVYSVAVELNAIGKEEIDGLIKN